jgi:hypothetical protein
MFGVDCLENDIAEAVKRWGVDREMNLPPAVLTTYIMGCLQQLDTAVRRTGDIERAEQ